MVEVVFLHIGLPKTGSSSIQSFMRQNRAALAARSVLYPDRRGSCETTGADTAEFTEPAGNAILLVRQPPTDAATSAASAETSPYREALRKLLARPEQKLVLSSELLHLWSFADFAAFRDQVASAGGTLRVVVYIREQVEQMISFHLQSVKHLRKTTSPEVDIRKQFEQRDLATVGDRLNYGHLLDGLADVVGPENLLPRVFERAQLVGQDVVLDFAEAIGLTDLAGLDRPEREVNPNLSPPLLLIKRELNRLLPGESAIGHRFLEVAQEMPGGTEATYDIISAELAAEIRAHYQDSNEAVRQRWFADRPQPLFRQRPIRTAPEPKIEELDPALVLEVLGRLVVKVLPKDSERVRGAGRKKRAAAKSTETALPPRDRPRARQSPTGEAGSAQRPANLDREARRQNRAARQRLAAGTPMGASE